MDKDKVKKSKITGIGFHVPEYVVTNQDLSAFMDTSDEWIQTRTGIQEALDHNNLSINDVSLIIPHQSNLRIIQSIAKRLNLGLDKMYINIQRYGNTTAASIPIAICEAMTEGKICKGDLIILAAFGAGYTWASAAIRW